MCGHGYGKTPGTSCKFKESNKVEVVIEPETPEIMIHKEQRFAPRGSYTTDKLTGKLGQTVDYLITVENTGNVPLHFMSLTDAHCTHIQPSGKPNWVSAAKSPSPANTRWRKATNRRT